MDLARLTRAGACAALAVLAQAALAADLPPRPSVADIVSASKPSDWRALDPANTLYVELPAGRVVIEMAPWFAPQTIANIRVLAREKYFDGLAIIRSQDNYVVQWGDPNEETNPRPLGSAKKTIPAEFTAPIAADRYFTRLKDKDGYAPQVGLSNGFPAAHDPTAGRAWMTHCYGMVGVARDNGDDTGNGSQLYVVNGHAPRHLDRNITVVGRVVAGMPLLSTVARGSGERGFYVGDEARMPVKSIRVAEDVPLAERSRLEVMRTDSAAYAKVVDAVRQRGGPWFKYSPNHVELCNAPIPVREAK